MFKDSRVRSVRTCNFGLWSSGRRGTGICLLTASEGIMSEYVQPSIFDGARVFAPAAAILGDLGDLAPPAKARPRDTSRPSRM